MRENSVPVFVEWLMKKTNAVVVKWFHFAILYGLEPKLYYDFIADRQNQRILNTINNRFDAINVALSKTFFQTIIYEKFTLAQIYLVLPDLNENEKDIIPNNDPDDVKAFWIEILKEWVSFVYEHNAVEFGLDTKYLINQAHEEHRWLHEMRDKEIFLKNI